MIDYINSQRCETHHHDRADRVPATKSIVNQRGRGRHPKKLRPALRPAPDPDVILVGERDYGRSRPRPRGRDRPRALHPPHPDATETINRIISVFPPHQQKQIRLQLSGVLKAVISMRLVPRADGHGRVPAVEVMIATPFIRDCIINKDKTKLIHEAIAAGVSQYGMQTFDQSIFQLYKKELITYDEALRRASNPDEFKLKIQGIQSTSDMAAEEMEKTMQSFETE
jgi:twitching motility protein PilT